MYNDLRQCEDDNPTVGILLCGSKAESVARDSVLHESEQLFASQYQLVLSAEEALWCEIEREQAESDARQALRGKEAALDESVVD